MILDLIVLAAMLFLAWQASELARSAILRRRGPGPVTSVYVPKDDSDVPF